MELANSYSQPNLKCRATIGPPALKRHSNGVSLADRWWPALEMFTGGGGGGGGASPNIKRGFSIIMIEVLRVFYLPSYLFPCVYVYVEDLLLQFMLASTELDWLKKN